MTCLDKTGVQPTLTAPLTHDHEHDHLDTDPVDRDDDHPSDTIRRRNPKKQGLIGLGAAIAWFTENGYEVLLPLNDSQKYDLAIEDEDGALKKVQVKTATHRHKSGSYFVSLSTNGGNQSRNTVELFAPEQYELLFVLTDSNERYLIPTRAIDAKHSINVGPKWREYLVE